MARFGTASEACDAFRRDLLSAAVERLGCDAQELGLREAFALFRLCTNPVRNITHSWRWQVETGLSLVTHVLEGEL